MLPLRVGITGGIGSGKTTACRVFEALGIPVYYSDERAKWLMNNSLDLKKQIIGLLGELAYSVEGKIDNKYIASQVFNDPAKLNALNHIVHPAVADDAQNWTNEQEGVPYTLKESALLFEIGSERSFDKTIVVYAPKEARVLRAMHRDGATRESIEARMAKQMDDELKLQKADFVIFNDGSQPILPQIVKIHRALISMFRSSNC